MNFMVSYNLQNLSSPQITIQCLRKGDVLTLDKDYKNLYIIIGGVLHLGKLSLNNQIITMAILKFKQCFIISNSSQYQLKSVTTSSLLIIKLNDLSDLISQIPELFSLITHGLLEYCKVMETFSYIYRRKTTYKRILLLLLFLIKYFGVNTSNGIKISLKFSQADIAQILGTTRTSVNRVFQILQKMKYLEIYANIIIIKEPLYLIGNSL
uniref:global nitrogen transcriptional regulator n=1 Tax=Goniotrichopsis reniformis TaxID=468933 RepID=UPI001FCDA970|nr:global nitrogen transcriptional regulator [Goniotrichopsis reniformis]UNJ14891.1 global nitrogen transcriptional regulator [Goniotrichopsis reniformis]